MTYKLLKEKIKQIDAEIEQLISPTKKTQEVIEIIFKASLYNLIPPPKKTKCPVCNKKLKTTSFKSFIKLPVYPRNYYINYLFCSCGYEFMKENTDLYDINNLYKLLK